MSTIWLYIKIKTCKLLRLGKLIEMDVKPHNIIFKLVNPMRKTRPVHGTRGLHEMSRFCNDAKSRNSLASC